MKIFYKAKELSNYLKQVSPYKGSVGFVPTMGALHKGHLSLISKALNENTLVVVSIFVNPTQFNNPYDLETYPRTLDKDLLLLKTLSKGVVVFAPGTNELYHDTVEAERFYFGGIESQMEGAHRPGHFDGVATVVKKLFEVVQPHKAYFGEKDYQQLQIIKRLVYKHKIPVTIISCPIFRETDGLAMSSRNVKLSPAHRAAAPFIFKTLCEAKQQFVSKSITNIQAWIENQYQQQPLLELEYFTIANQTTLKPVKRKRSNTNYRAFIAMYAGDVRVIDNLALN